MVLHHHPNPSTSASESELEEELSGSVCVFLAANNAEFLIL
jgi:hypothetical protein